MTTPARNAGFSLLEVTCAIVILGVALVGLTQGITTALSSNKESEIQTAAAWVAAGQIETVRAEGSLRDGVEEGGGSGDVPGYRWKRTISPTGIEGLHEVQVSVENAKSGKPVFELRTLLFEPPEDSALRPESRQRASGPQRKRASR
jgi:prepilin-type N-terminal cleavage/methylation domain-containing protein